MEKLIINNDIITCSHAQTVTSLSGAKRTPGIEEKFLFVTGILGFFGLEKYLNYKRIFLSKYNRYTGATIVYNSSQYSPKQAVALFFTYYLKSFT